MILSNIKYHTSKLTDIPMKVAYNQLNTLIQSMLIYS